jgi:F0F1-type ATP synthase membrane subunit b/b'
MRRSKLMKRSSQPPVPRQTPSAQPLEEEKTKAFADVGAIAEETATAVVEQLIGGTVAKADVAAAVASANVKQEG